MFEYLMKAYAGLVAALTVAVLVYVYTTPLPALHKTRDGVPYFTPQVINPATGKPVDVGELIRHFRGD